MYSKQEASALKQQFWTAFGRYMHPVLSAEGEKINWINYKTGEKHIYFRMEAGVQSATIAIELTHKDAGIQSLYINQFKQLQHLLFNALHEQWNWQLLSADDTGKPFSRMYASVDNVNMYNAACWPTLISFFKPRIIALDAFWSVARHAFELLR